MTKLSNGHSSPVGSRLAKGVRWHIPHCAYCEEPIEEVDDFTQHFVAKLEGGYYMHTGCYADWQRDQPRYEDPQWPKYTA